MDGTNLRERPTTSGFLRRRLSRRWHVFLLACGGLSDQARVIPFGYFWFALSSLKMVTSSLQANLDFMFVLLRRGRPAGPRRGLRDCGVLGSLLAFFYSYCATGRCQPKPASNWLRAPSSGYA